MGTEWPFLAADGVPGQIFDTYSRPKAASRPCAVDRCQSKRQVVAYDGPGVDRCGDIFKQMSREPMTGAVARRVADGHLNAHLPTSRSTNPAISRRPAS